MGLRCAEALGLDTKDIHVQDQSLRVFLARANDQEGLSLGPIHVVDDGYITHSDEGPRQPSDLQGPSPVTSPAKVRCGDPD